MVQNTAHPRIMSVSLPAVLLRLEGAALLIAAVAAYAHLHASGLLFALLLLAPDLSMIGYMLGTQRGAWLYNLAHTTLLPAALAAAALALEAPIALHIALIWLAHIGMDRAVGYGLKYETGFKDTHLSRV